MSTRSTLPAFFQDTFGRLDILVNNPGIFLEWSGPVTVEAFRQCFEANVIAPYAITDALLPLLRVAPGGRIVNHSSTGGSLASVRSDQWPADYLFPIYSSSKAALNMLTVIQARMLQGTPIKVNAANPGNVLTDMNPRGGLSVEEGAKTAVRLATLPADGPTGGFFHLDETLPW